MNKNTKNNQSIRFWFHTKVKMFCEPLLRLNVSIVSLQKKRKIRCKNFNGEVGNSSSGTERNFISVLLTTTKPVQDDEGALRLWIFRKRKVSKQNREKRIFETKHYKQNSATQSNGFAFSDISKIGENTENSFNSTNIRRQPI